MSPRCVWLVWPRERGLVGMMMEFLTLSCKAGQQKTWERPPIRRCLLSSVAMLLKASGWVMILERGC